jgi:hypothetical protein
MPASATLKNADPQPLFLIEPAKTPGGAEAICGGLRKMPIQQHLKA